MVVRFSWRTGDACTHLQAGGARLSTNERDDRLSTA